MKAIIESCECCYCGKKFERKASRIKNRDLTFCDNLCRARYAEKNAIEEDSLYSEQLPAEIEFCSKIISSCYVDVVRQFKLQGRVSFKEMEQEALIAIWKWGKRANNGKGRKGSFYYSAIKHRMMDYARLIISKSDARDEIMDENRSLIYYTTPEHLYQMKMTADYLLNRKQRRGSNAYWLLLKYSFENVSISDLAKQFSKSERDITIAISNARKQLAKELERRQI